MASSPDAGHPIARRSRLLKPHSQTRVIRPQTRAAAVGEDCETDGAGAPLHHCLRSAPCRSARG
eukprot:5608361-Pleurochrysis_carterae.AAC.2